MPPAQDDAPTPITIVTGFLGAGKTTVILNLLKELKQRFPTYKAVLIKNEFGDLAIDSQLASASSISGVRELLNGCICCNLVGQLGPALEELKIEHNPDRIFVETSGSTFPATLALEINRLIREGDGRNFVLDGVVSVVDVENWEGYDDTSLTAKMQQQYTDLVVFNKWENVSERRFDTSLDRLGDLETQTPWVKSDKGAVSIDILLGIDSVLAKQLKESDASRNDHHRHDHQSEVEVLSAILQSSDGSRASIDLDKLNGLLSKAPKDEVYRIKAVLYSVKTPSSSNAEDDKDATTSLSGPTRYILNWAFGRWTFSAVQQADNSQMSGSLTPPDSDSGKSDLEAALRMTMICARGESTKWKKRLESGDVIALDSNGSDDMILRVDRIS